MENKYVIRNIVVKNEKSKKNINHNELIGKEISIVTDLELHESLIFEVLEDSRFIRTSPVESYNRARNINSVLFVETRNTLYEFSPVVKKEDSYKENFVEDMNELIEAFKQDSGISVKDISDGYHTFDELYYHRMVLFAMLCNTYNDKSWKSWHHHDGTMFGDDMFICGIETPDGQYTYHYKKEHWNKFNVVQLLLAPHYDGHQPKDIDRLFSLLK